jgi:hypothetical protein
MNLRFIPISLLAVLIAGGIGNAYPTPFFGQEPQKQPKAQPKQAAVTSLTGCVDEQDSRYVLTDDRTLTPIANLQADGFPTEGFAKHMGHKVTVRGTSSPGTPIPVFKVRSIETISDTCAPQQ